MQQLGILARSQKKRIPQSLYLILTTTEKLTLIQPYKVYHSYAQHSVYTCYAIHILAKSDIHEQFEIP